jgi:hypothetical protein
MAERVEHAVLRKACILTFVDATPQIMNDDPIHTATRGMRSQKK